LHPLDQLARAYQNANRHDEALAVFAIIQKELPKLVEEKWFRNLVAKSEKSSGRKDSQLPQVPFSWKRLFGARSSPANPRVTARGLLVVGVILAMVALGFVLGNEYIRRHRTLFIVNQLPQPVSVRIDGVANLAQVRGLRRIELAEGQYRAVISGAAQEQVDFTLRTSYFSRWFGDPVWVLNVDGAAILIQSQVTYAGNPPPPVIAFHFGRLFETFPRVTHAFSKLPESLRLKSTEKRTLVGLEVHQGDGSDVFGYYLDRKEPGQAMNFAESWLQSHPADEGMLRLYGFTATQRQQTNRFMAFLKSGLTTRPVRIEWHRVYQGFYQNREHSAALVAEYDALLGNEPTNSAMLYLRGRIEHDRARARQLFEQATAADARNPYPLFAMGFDRMAAADWVEARGFLMRAAELRPGDQSFDHWLFLARVGAGEQDKLEQELRKKIGGDPVNVLAHLRLIDVLGAQNRREEVASLCSQFDRVASAQYRQQARSLTTLVRNRGYYAVGDFVSLQKAAAQQTTPTARTLEAEALIEQGRVNDAIKLISEPDQESDRTMMGLAVALAFRQAGDDRSASQWEIASSRLLANGDEDYQQVAAIFERVAPPSIKEIQDLVVMPQLKSVLLANLAFKYPDHRREFTALSRKLNVDGSFPHHLIQRATQ
jgi:tetratricopeptide (TPR) repeat protein